MERNQALNIHGCMFLFQVTRENVDRNLVLAVSEQDDKLGKRLFFEKKKKEAKDNTS